MSLHMACLHSDFIPLGYACSYQVHLYVLPVSVRACIEVLLFINVIVGAPPQPFLLGLLSVARGSVKEPVVFDSVHVRACTSACVCVCASVYVCMCVHACTRAHVCMCVCMYGYLCVCMCFHIHVCVCMCV